MFMSMLSSSQMLKSLLSSSKVIPNDKGSHHLARWKPSCQDGNNVVGVIIWRNDNIDVLIWPINNIAQNIWCYVPSNGIIILILSSGIIITVLYTRKRVCDAP